jgi:hypothetical protein
MKALRHNTRMFEQINLLPVAYLRRRIARPDTPSEGKVDLLLIMEHSRNFSEYPKINVFSRTAVQQREKKMKFRDRDAFLRRLAQSSDSITAKGSRCLEVLK